MFLNSSYNGFHIHIPAKYMPKREIYELIGMINNAVYNLKGIYEINSIDTSIFDIKRVCKIPYSYECSGAIVIPLSDTQLKNYSPERVKCENVLKNVMIKNRGLLIRNLELGEEQLKANVKKFISEFV